MSNYNNLKTAIDANIKQNGNQEITGPIRNSVLNQMVNILGTGYQFAGVATLDPATEPGTPDAKVFYIANGKGTYTNFGGIEVTEDDVVVLYWDTAWHKVATGIASQAKLSELESEVNGNDNSKDFDFAIAASNVDYTKTVDVKAGKYNITVDDADNALPKFTIIYLNGTRIGYLKSLTNPVTISEDVTTIRLYSSAQATNSGDITIHFVDIAPSKSLSERIDEVKAEADSNSQEVESLKDDVNFVVRAEWYQGSIAAGGGYSENNTRVTSAKPIQTPAKIVSTSSVKIYQIVRYKKNKSPETGGTTGTDFIMEEYDSSLKSSLVVYPNEDFPNVYVGLRKANASETVLVSEVESSITVYYEGSLQARVSTLESPSATKVVDFGVIKADPNNDMSYYWLNTPAKFKDYSEIHLTVNKEDGINNKILVYAVYGNASNKERVLPDISASGETVIRIPANERESLYGILLYNLYNISYEITARITLSAKKDATKYLDTVDQNANILPAYYFANDYVFKRRAVINKYLRENILLGDAFYFVTDTHWEFNQRHSPALIREINKKLNIQRVFHGGDLYHNSPVADAYETDCVNAYLAGIGNDKVAVTLGNHEFLASETWADAFVRTSMHLENAQFGGPNKQYFYIDNLVKKIRYIVLYSYGQRDGGSYTYGYNDQEQMGWLNDVALNVESGWDIFIFTHYVTSPRLANNEYAAIGGYDNFANLVNGYNGNGRIVAIITGHTHRDFVLLDRTNMPIIITTCDNNANFTEDGISDFDNLQTPRTNGTVNEQAVDTVIYDRGNCLLHFIRLGSEADNKMNLLTNNVQVACRSIYCSVKSVGDSIELPTYLTSGVTWASSDTSVATVSSGIASCVGVGCVRITATDSNGEKQSFYLRVE